jgi:hypothetical protein
MRAAEVNQSDAGSARVYQGLSQLTDDRVTWCCVLVLWGAVVANVIAARQATWSLQPQEFDLVHALPMGFWASLVVGTFAGVVALWRAQTEGAITSCVVGEAVLYGPSFLLGVYPAISGWDSYTHASSARSLIEGAGISTNSFYARQYPGPSTLLALVAHTLGMEPLVTGVIVTIAVEVGLALVFMGVARTVLGLKASGWTALAILALTPAIATNEHFSQWLIAYMATWGIVLLIAWSWQEEDTGWVGASACAIILGGAVIVSHPFLPVIATALVLGFATWSWRERSKKSESMGWLAITLAVGASAWMIYVATLYLAQGVSVIRDVLLGTKDTIATWAPLPIIEVLRRMSVLGKALILSRWAAYGSIGLTALSGLLLPKQRKTVILVLWLIIACVASVLVGFSSEAPWFQRILYFAPPLLTVAAGVAFSGWMSRLQVEPRWQAVGIIAAALSLVAGFFLWHPPTLIYSVHPLQAGFVMWPQEAAAAQYVANTAPDNDVIGSDLETMIVYLYYKPGYPAYVYGISIGANLRKQLSENPVLYDGTWIIRSRRQEIMGLQAQDLDPAFWGSVDTELARVAERVYDNGFVVVYHKR